jgi:hypothetical protein
MTKLTKKQRREKRKRKKIQAKRRQEQKKSKKPYDLKPWERPRMKMFQMPQLLPPEVSKEDRIKIVKSIGAKAQKDFEEKYPKIDEWFQKYDALYLLSFCSVYFMSMPEGIDPEALGKMDFYHHYLEIMQAFALRQKRSYNLKPLFNDAEKLDKEMQEIGQAMSLRHLNIPETIKTDEEMFAHRLRTEMMGQTAAIRNWAYHHQILKVTSEIADIVKEDFERLYKVNPKTFFQTLFNLALERNETLNDHLDKVRTFIRKKNYKEMIDTYSEMFQNVEKMTSEQIENLWDQSGKNLKNLKNMLICHSDLQLEKIYSFDIKHFLTLYKEKVDETALKALLDKLSCAFGDLAKANPEHFILANPVHLRPFIKTGDDTYYSSVFGIFHHISLGILEDLISIDAKFQKKYEDELKPQYLEDKLEVLLDTSFPNARIYRNVKYGKDYEADFIIILDTFILVVEAKAGKISPRAKRGDPANLFKTLERLIEDPSTQAHRLINFLKENPKGHSFSCKGGSCNIDSSKINYWIPLGVTLSHIGAISSNLKKLIEAKVTSKSIRELAPSISFTDLECVFELLPLEAQKVHYLERRREIEDHLQYEGDELDLLGFYLDNGFNIGEDEYKGDIAINMTMKSKELDPYFVGTNEGKKVEKPKVEMTQWWQDILNFIEIRKPQNWIETSFILLNSTKEDQEKFFEAFQLLIKRIHSKKVEKKHNWVSFLSGPEIRRYLIVGYPYTTTNKKERNNVMMEILNSADANKVKGVVVIGVNINSTDYPYSVLAGKLDTNLFDI